MQEGAGPAPFAGTMKKNVRRTAVGGALTLALLGLAPGTAHATTRQTGCIVAPYNVAYTYGLCKINSEVNAVMQAGGHGVVKCAEGAATGVIGDAIGTKKRSKWGRLKGAVKKLEKRAPAVGAALSCVGALLS